MAGNTLMSLLVKLGVIVGGSGSGLSGRREKGWLIRLVCKEGYRRGYGRSRRNGSRGNRWRGCGSYSPPLVQPQT